MASRSDHKPGGGPKRTGGVVSHVTERFGFIELTNKNISFSKVYFDFSSFEGYRGKDLSKIFPTGTNVTLTFVASGGDHQVKHRAVNLMKTDRSSGHNSQAAKQMTEACEVHQRHKYQDHSQTKRCQHQRQHFNQQDFGRKNENPFLDGQGSAYPHEPRAGSTYPHDWYFPQSREKAPTVKNLRQVHATQTAELVGLAKTMWNHTMENAASQQASTQPQNPSDKKRRGKQRNRKEKKGDKGGFQRAFSDSSDVKDFKAPQPCSEDSAVGPQHAHATSSVPMEVLVQQAQPEKKSDTGQKNRKKNSRLMKDELFKAQEARTLQNLLGNELGTALRTKLTSLQAKSLNDLLLLRISVGKKPTIRVFLNDESSNHTLEETKSVVLEDVQRLLRHKDVVKSSTPLRYGVKGTLHSIRTMEQNGKLNGLTIFCQLHEDHDGLGLEVIEDKGLTVIVGDARTCPMKYFYNYMRCKSKEMMKTKDVLVLDVDGQLSGCDDSPHSSLGDVTRLSCSSSVELPGKITESIGHLHECVIAIGVDSMEAIQALQKMAGKGAQVFAEISPEMKSFFSD